jgi:hypothetical protein
MMHNQLQQPVHSEYRQYQSPFLRQWFQPYILEEHVTTASHQTTKNNSFSTQIDHTLTFNWITNIQ